MPKIMTLDILLRFTFTFGVLQNRYWFDMFTKGI